MSGSVSFEEYCTNDQLRWAVERQLTIVGEALYQLHQNFPDRSADIPDAQRIIRFRHVLIHGYSGLDHENVWRIAKKNVPELIPLLKRLLNL
ncbi:MAG: DUF86 domain-containing protein [Candidatus Hydrogenedentes bacterium]|nr:DUF86 domain-containing protein [Candidatus Hydrogenedentota bacterium]